MIAPRWRKVLLDLWSNRARTVLVVLSIAVGVFAVGWNTSTFSILSHDLDADFLSVNPYSAIIYCMPFDEEVVASAQRVPGVKDAEGRSSLSLRIASSGGDWRPLAVTSIPSIEEMKIGRLRPEMPADSISLGNREILIERTGRSMLPVKPGDMVKVELYDGRVRELRVAGIVHDVTSFSSAFSGQVSAYVTPATFEWLGGSRDFNEMHITVAEKSNDEEHVKAVAGLVAEKIEKSGRQVFVTLVFEPGHHPMRSTTLTLGVIMGTLGGLAVFFSAFLVINTITALLSQHTRQIGVMKAIGANTPQVVGMYIVLVLGFGVLALLLALPLSTLASFGIISFLSGFLNFKLTSLRIPPESLALQVVVALGVPLLGALIPVLNGTRITVREAISSYGLSKDQYGRSRFDRLLEKIRHLPRPILISLRNTFRRKARLAMTLFTLMLGGAIFIAVFSVRASFYITIDQVLGYFLSDVNLSLNRLTRIERVQDLVMADPDVVRMEAWEITTAQYLSEDKATGADVLIWGPPADSDLIQPVITSGRWLLPEDQNAIVLSHQIIVDRPELKVGDLFYTKISGKEYSWRVVGVAQMPGNFIPPFIYANYDYLSTLLGNSGRSGYYRIVTAKHDLISQTRVAKTIEQRLGEAGIGVAQITTGSETITQQRLVIDILMYTLLIMAVIIAIVGGIGLMGTMSMNVLERTREIGVMRSIGASSGILLSMVVIEGVLIGLISWILGALASIPVSVLMGIAIGNSFISSPLPFVFSMDGFIIWLVIVLIVSALASLLPARNATRLTVRDVLAYE